MSGGPSGNLWYLLGVLGRRRNLVVGVVLLGTLAAVVVSLLLPKYYRAEALLLPPKDVTVPVAGMGAIADVVSVTKGLNLPVMATASDVYVRMLKSRRVTDTVIQEYDLLERYGARNQDEAYLAFMDRTDFEVTVEGLLRVSVEDRDPVAAAAMVNLLVDRLDEVNRRIATSRARQNREFLEGRLTQVEAALDSARAAFQDFQMAHRAIDFDQQTHLAVEQAVNLKVMLAAIDVELRLQEGKLGSGNTELQELRRRRGVVAGELSKLENENRDSSFFSLPISSVPALRGQYQELYSRVQVNESLYSTLLSYLEQAKIQENEELPTLTVLDRARPPELRSRPKRTLIVAGSFGGALVLSMLLALSFDFFGRMRESSPEDYQRLSLFVRSFLGWLPGVRRAAGSTSSRDEYNG